MSHGDAGTTVPILLYHAITDSPGNHIAPYAVSPGAFAAQLDLLLQLGHRCVRMTDLDRPGTWTRDGRVAAVSFDDGYADFATAALPALESRAVPATLYVTTGWLRDGGPRPPGPSDPMLSWRQLPELRDRGVELGAHSHSHPEMDTLSARVLRDELSRPKQMLEDVLGHPVHGMAYPHGYNGRRVRRATADAGYLTGVSVHNTRHHRAEDRYDISRLLVTRDLSLDDLAAWLTATRGGVRRRDSPATRAWRTYRRGRALVRGRPGSAYA